MDKKSIMTAFNKDRPGIVADVTESVGVRILLLGIVAGFAAFWTWALFFASKEAVNRIDDRGWAERAEAICEPVEQELLRLDLITSVSGAAAALALGKQTIALFTARFTQHVLDAIFLTGAQVATGQQVAGLAVLGQPAPEQRAGDVDRGQGVADLVGQACRHLSHSHQAARPLLLDTAGGLGSAA